MEDLKNKTNQELLGLFDRASWSLGFSSLSTKTYQPMQAEVALATVAYCVSQKDLKLSRFLPVLLNWLKVGHRFLDKQKLQNVTNSAENSFGEMPALRLTLRVLNKVAPEFNLDVKPLSGPFYTSLRNSSLVEMKLKTEGFFLPEDQNFRVSKNAFPFRDSDYLPEFVIADRLSMA